MFVWFADRENQEQKQKRKKWNILLTKKEFLLRQERKEGVKTMGIDELTEDVTFYARLLQQEKRYEACNQANPCLNYWSKARLSYENELARKHDTSIDELRGMATELHYRNELYKLEKKE